jgi:hypothetical protein
MTFPDAGSSAFRVCLDISLIINNLTLAMFFAFSALLVSKLFIINELLVEAAGVGLVLSTENT